MTRTVSGDVVTPIVLHHGPPAPGSRHVIVRRDGTVEEARPIKNVTGEVLTDSGLGVPPRLSTRDLSRMRNVTPGSEAPAPPPRRCSSGFAGCFFDPPHVHGRQGVVSPACSNCATVFRLGREDYEVEYDERGWCRACRGLLAAYTEASDE